MLLLRNELTLFDSQNSLFYDRTGTTAPDSYGKDGNITYADVDAVRILVATYTTLSGFYTLEEGQEFTQYTQYIKTSQNSSVINGKTFAAGSLFIPQVADLVVPTDDTWESTGYYNPPILATWLPTATEVALNLNVEEFGQQADTDIEQNIYPYQYEVYVNAHSATFAATDGLQYLVISGSCTYGGNTYIAGEVFIGQDTDNITIVTASVGELSASNYSYAALCYQIETGLNDLVEAQFGLNNQNLIQPTENAIMKIYMQLQALKACAYTKTVSLQYCYQTILNLQNRITLLLTPSI